MTREEAVSTVAEAGLSAFVEHTLTTARLRVLAKARTGMVAFLADPAHTDEEQNAKVREGMAILDKAVTAGKELLAVLEFEMTVCRIALQATL